MAKKSDEAAAPARRVLNPTRKQFKLARKLSKDFGADIPRRALYDRNVMSGFIAGLKAARDAS